LAEHRILISEGLAGNIAEWPSSEDAALISARTPRPPVPIGLPGCSGWSIALLAGRIASLMEEG
jgi:hypothetical protein